MTKKYTNDKGEIGIMVSSGFGAGLSTWNRDYKEILFDAELITLLLAENFDKLREVAEKKYPDAYLGGLNDCYVVFLPKGTKFIINEYDGSETLQIMSDIDYFTA